MESVSYDLTSFSIFAILFYIKTIRVCITCIALNSIRKHFGKQNNCFFVVADFDKDTVRCRFAFGVNECADVCGNYASFLTYNWVIDFVFFIPNITTLHF